MTILFSAQNLNYQIDSKEIFQNISFEISAGSITEIRGGNGCGKSSMLKIICGLISNEKISFHEDVNENISYLGHTNGMLDELTFRQNFKLDNLVINSEYAKELNIFQLRSQKLNNLSYGEKRKVALLKVIQANRKVWVLDEPFAGLDDASISTLVQIFAHHVKNSGTVILANHQADISGSKKIILGSSNV